MKLVSFYAWILVVKKVSRENKQRTSLPPGSSTTPYTTQNYRQQFFKEIDRPLQYTICKTYLSRGMHSIRVWENPTIPLIPSTMYFPIAKHGNLNKNLVNFVKRFNCIKNMGMSSKNCQEHNSALCHKSRDSPWRFTTTTTWKSINELNQQMVTRAARKTFEYFIYWSESQRKIHRN